MANIDQRKYLKKYLDDDEAKHRKKKKREHSSSHSGRVKIVDDDAGYTRTRKYDDDDLTLTGEDAPQIAGIIDERPPELQAAEDFRNSSKWRTLGESADRSSRAEGRSFGTSSKNNDRRRTKSPPPPRRDNSPGRRKAYKNLSSSSGRKRHSDDDYSPVRRKRDDEARTREVSNRSDQSPTQRKCNESDEDLSPIRRKNRHEEQDLSPVQRRIPNKHSASLTRKSRDDDDLSPIRKKAGERNNQNDIRGSGRKTRWNSDDDLSPIRRKLSASPPPDQKNPFHSRNRHGDSLDDGNNTKMKKTLDGKRAGLQDAKMLKKETDEFRRREDELFNNMSNVVSGRDAEVVVRDKKSGRVRDLEKVREKEEEKEKRDKERAEIYKRWGKGLKQVEDYRNRITDDQHESNKPLARYSNDADLDKMLRDQERADDPMLEYMRQKKAKTTNTPQVPTYKGPFPENRFNIRPGYRWDGVDRSNGYEKKWLNVQNQKVATQEEAYRYSTEDM